MWLLPNGVDYELIHATCTMFLKKLNPFGWKGIETVHNGKRSLGPQTSIDSKQTKKTIQLSIYYGKGRMTLGRGLGTLLTDQDWSTAKDWQQVPSWVSKVHVYCFRLGYSDFPAPASSLLGVEQVIYLSLSLF